MNKQENRGVPVTPEGKLAALGAAVVEIQAEALKMLAQGTPRSGIDHWTARELFHATRKLGLLPKEARQ